MNWLTSETLALIFAGLTAFSILLYAMLDGYDLGVGVTLNMQNEAWRDTAIASIGPFWDANETWLVLAVGLLLVAFPAAHSEILKSLYLPAAALLVGLILRGVAFDFRAKVKPHRKRLWDRTFKVGSFIAAFSQGFMLGQYVMGLNYTLASVVFSVFSGICVTAAYALIGNAWLFLKTSDNLQSHALKQCKKAGVVAFAGILGVSLINPIVNVNVYQIWTQPPFAYLYAFIPMLCFGMFLLGYTVIRHFEKSPNIAAEKGQWLPFMICCVIFITCFVGLAVSFYPFVVPNQMTIFDAASAAESLNIIFIGACLVIPIIASYTAFCYFVFRGKADSLRYY
ncbi:MAG: cytochrome d ubiquinol oxidase subunit II [Pseudomonadota bacterium]